MSVPPSRSDTIAQASTSAIVPRRETGARARRRLHRSCGAGGGVGVEVGERGREPIGMIAEHPVDAGVEEIGDLPWLLGIPTEGETFEAVEQGDQPTRPIHVAQVHGIDAGVALAKGSALGAFTDLGQPRGIDQPGRRGVPPGDQLIEIGVAQPEPILGAGLSGHRNDRVERRRVLDVERDRMVRPDGVVELGQARNVLGQFRSAHRSDRAASQPWAERTIVIEHGDTVGGDPHVALESRRPELDGEREALERVLGGVGTGSTVGKRNRDVEQGRQSGRHDDHPAPRDPPQPPAGRAHCRRGRRSVFSCPCPQECHPSCRTYASRRRNW